MTHVDVNTTIGGYPYRHVPHPEPAMLVTVLEREGLTAAWVGHLPSAFHRDPEPGNEELFASLLPFGGTLRPVPALRPDWPGWERRLAQLIDAGAMAIRAYPSQWMLPPQHTAMRRIAGACGESGLPLVLTVRFEDVRQRHPLDSAPDLSGAAIRDVVRAHPDVKVVVTCAGRSLIEEVHWGLTGAESDRLWWDISWVWGPPEDDLAHLFATIGSRRFVYGTGWPLRLAQAPRANLALLPPPFDRSQLASVAEIERAR